MPPWALQLKPTQRVSSLAIIPRLPWFSAELQSQSNPPRSELPRNFVGYELFQDQQGRDFWTHACCSRERERERSVDCILFNRLVRFSSLGSERTISTDINTNLKHLQAGSQEKERSGLMSFLLMPLVNEQPRVLLPLRTEMLFFFFLNPSVSHIQVWRKQVVKIQSSYLSDNLITETRWLQKVAN